MQRKIITCDRCGKEFDHKLDRGYNFRYEYLTVQKLADVHEEKVRGDYFRSKDICEDCYEQFCDFITRSSETVPGSVEEAFNSICKKLTGLDRAEAMRILNEGNEEKYEKLFEMALDVPLAPVYMYFGAEANSNPDHIGKLKVIDDVVMFINNKAYFSIPFTKEEAEGICKFLAFIKQNHIVETIGDISNIETYHSKEWEEQLELEQINQKEWAKLDEETEETS